MRRHLLHHRLYQLRMWHAKPILYSLQLLAKALIPSAFREGIKSRTCPRRHWSRWRRGRHSPPECLPQHLEALFTDGPVINVDIRSQELIRELKPRVVTRSTLNSQHELLLAARLENLQASRTSRTKPRAQARLSSAWLLPS